MIAVGLEGAHLLKAGTLYCASETGKIGVGVPMT